MYWWTKCHILLVYSLTSRHLCRFCISAEGSNAPVNTGLQIPFQHGRSSSFKCTPRSGIPGSCARSSFLSVLTHTCCGLGPRSPHSHWAWLSLRSLGRIGQVVYHCPVIFMITILTVVKWHPVVALIWMFLIISDDEFSFFYSHVSSLLVFKSDCLLAIKFFFIFLCIWTLIHNYPPLHVCLKIFSRLMFVFSLCYFLYSAKSF